MNRRVLISCLMFAAAPLAAETPQPVAPAPPPATPPPACTGPQHSQFDFWVGSWSVSQTAGGKVVAHSLIEKLYGGCVIRENWMPSAGTPGGSLNNFVIEDGKWHQTWVDASNARVEFSGGMEGAAMVLTGYWKDANGPGQSGLVRMRYTTEKPGEVRQAGEISLDDGKSWKPFFDFTYKPARAGG
jgi:hypothetical protein